MTPAPARPACTDTPLIWRCVPFDQLSARELYALLQLRSAVFVVEQRCVFQDLDGADTACHHLLGMTSSHGGLEPPTLRAYTRLVPAGVKYPQASIGRVVTAPETRGLALGHALMARSCEWLSTLWGPQPIRIGAQAHLQGFYARHGFVTVGAPYLEDGIAHVEMLRPTPHPHPQQPTQQTAAAGTTNTPEGLSTP
jgi:ElaA protein